MAPREGQQIGDVRDTDIVVGVDGSPSAKTALRPRRPTPQGLIDRCAGRIVEV
jgi:hypothetical protein